MQDKKYLATIVPLGPQARKQIQKGENLDVIRAAVWSETAKKLTPLLGSVCSRFLPATYAWSICNYRPFGVMLGGVTADMEDMLLCYTRARLEQMNEIEARQQRLIAQGETLLNESPIQSLNITVVSIDSSEPGTRKELELAQKFFSGDVSAAAGIYYLGYNCNQISESQEEQLLENLQEYALCVAELQELELESLASLLDEEPETDVEAEEQEPVNSYLLHEVLPLLELGLYPRLADIDYDEFECYDPAALLGYIEESGRRMWNHGELIRSIRKIPPTCRAAFV